MIFWASRARGGRTHNCTPPTYHLLARRPTALCHCHRRLLQPLKPPRSIPTNCLHPAPSSQDHTASYLTELCEGFVLELHATKPASAAPAGAASGRGGGGRGRGGDKADKEEINLVRGVVVDWDDWGDGGEGVE